MSSRYRRGGAVNAGIPRVHPIVATLLVGVVVVVCFALIWMNRGQSVSPDGQSETVPSTPNTIATPQEPVNANDSVSRATLAPLEVPVPAAIPVVSLLRTKTEFRTPSDADMVSVAQLAMEMSMAYHTHFAGETPEQYKVRLRTFLTDEILSGQTFDDESSLAGFTMNIPGFSVNAVAVPENSTFEAWGEFGAIVTVELETTQREEGKEYQTIRFKHTSRWLFTQEGWLCESYKL